LLHNLLQNNVVSHSLPASLREMLELVITICFGYQLWQVSTILEIPPSDAEIAAEAGCSTCVVVAADKER